MLINTNRVKVSVPVNVPKTSANPSGKDYVQLMPGGKVTLQAGHTPDAHFLATNKGIVYTVDVATTSTVTASTVTASTVTASTAHTETDESSGD